MRIGNNAHIIDHSYDDDPIGDLSRFTGRRIDAEIGLYYYRTRYYSPTLGRFLQTSILMA